MAPSIWRAGPMPLGLSALEVHDVYNGGGLALAACLVARICALRARKQALQTGWTASPQPRVRLLILNG